jgi:hypothetical protein
MVDMEGLCRGEKFSFVMPKLMSENPPNMILRVFAKWDRRLWFCFLMEGGYAE